MLIISKFALPASGLFRRALRSIVNNNHVVPDEFFNIALNIKA